MDSEQEKQLVEKARTEIEAFGLLYDEYYPRILGYVIRRTASAEAAGDITSDVFFKAMRNIHRFQWRNIPFSAWLYRIANNEIIDHYRKNGRDEHNLEKVSNSVDYAEPSPEYEIEEAEAEVRKHRDFLLLHEQIAGLSDKYQEVITLRFMENRKINEIAEILGKREGTVKSLLHRGLEKLRISMERNATFL